MKNVSVLIVSFVSILSHATPTELTMTKVTGEMAGANCGYVVSGEIKDFKEIKKVIFDSHYHKGTQTINGSETINIRCQLLIHKAMEKNLPIKFHVLQNAKEKCSYDADSLLVDECEIVYQ